ncbi:MAG: NnrU family protein [Pseudomonadota bacterium]
MTLLMVGLAVFVMGHFWKRLMPSLYEGLGRGAKAISAGLTILGLLVIIYAYRSASFERVYDPPVWGTHLSWLLMFVAVGLLGAGHSKGRIRTWFRHPMLLSVIVWAIAHLLANGDLASVMLFGSLAIWAIAEIHIVNAATGAWTRPSAGPLARDFVLLAITIGAYSVMVGIHIWVGVNPFWSIL